MSDLEKRLTETLIPRQPDAEGYARIEAKTFPGVPGGRLPSTYSLVTLAEILSEFMSEKKIRLAAEAERKLAAERLAQATGAPVDERESITYNWELRK